MESALGGETLPTTLPPITVGDASSQTVETVQREDTLSRDCDEIVEGHRQSKASLLLGDSQSVLAAGAPLVPNSVQVSTAPSGQQLPITPSSSVAQSGASAEPQQLLVASWPDQAAPTGAAAADLGTGSRPESASVGPAQANLGRPRLKMSGAAAAEETSESEAVNAQADLGRVAAAVDLVMGHPSQPAGVAPAAAALGDGNTLGLESFMQTVDGFNLPKDDFEKVSGFTSMTDKLGAILHDKVEKGGDAFVEKMDLVSKAWKQACERGSWKSRDDPVGNAFNYDTRADPHLKIEAKAAKAKGKQAFLEWRTDWAKKRFASSIEGKMEVESFRTVDTTKGTYMTFGATVTFYGGWEWPPAIEGAKTAAAQCLAMRGKWIWLDPQSKMLNLFILKKEHSEDYVHKWESFKKELNDAVGVETSTAVVSAAVSPSASPGASPVLSAVPSPVVSEPETETPKAKKARIAAEKAALNPTPLATPKGKAAAKASPSGTGAELGLKDWIKLAIKLKSKYEKANSAGESLLMDIKENSKYSWAATPAMEGELQQLYQAVKQDLGGFGRQFMVKELKDMKAAFDANDLRASISAWVPTFEPKVDSLQAKIDEINRKHTA